MLKSPITSSLGIAGSVAIVFKALFDLWHGKEPEWLTLSGALLACISAIFSADHDKVVEVDKKIDRVASATGNTEVIEKMKVKEDDAAANKP